MRIYKSKHPIKELDVEHPSISDNESLEIGECIETPDGKPALELLIRTSNDTYKKLYLMKDRGNAFKICNISGMGTYVSNKPIGDDFIKSIYYSMMCELVLQLVSMFGVQDVEFYRGTSSNSPIEQFLSACIGEE